MAIKIIATIILGMIGLGFVLGLYLALVNSR